MDDIGAVGGPSVDAASAASLATFPRPPRARQLEELASALGATYDAVASIYSQGAQLAAAGPHARARRDAPAIAERFASMMIDAASSTSSAAASASTSTTTTTTTTAATTTSPSAALDALSAAARVPAALLLRRILECPPFSVPRGSVTEFMRAPRASAAARAAAEAAAAAREGEGEGEQETTTSTTTTTTTTTATLFAAAAEAAAAACASDPLYSPRGDALRHVAGLEAEALLCARLRSAGGGGGSGGGEDEERDEDEDGNDGGDNNSSSSGSRGVPFWTEEALRAGGFALTPDVRLATPVALPCGHVVHWVDSKATFGTVRMHEHYLEEQYARYTNRYGTGLVIYWSGFDERLLPAGSTPATTTTLTSTAAVAAATAAPASLPANLHQQQTQTRNPTSRPRWRAGVAVAATLPAALKGLRTLPRLRLPARAAPAPASQVE